MHLGLMFILQKKEHAMLKIFVQNQVVGPKFQTIQSESNDIRNRYR